MVALLTYGEVQQPEWYFGSGHLSGSVAHVTLMRMHGGAHLFSISPSAPPDIDSTMELDLEFRSNNEAMAWFTKLSDDRPLELSSVELTRLPVTQETTADLLSGEWILLSDNPDSKPARLLFGEVQTLAQKTWQVHETSRPISLLCTWSSSDKFDRCELHNAENQSITAFETLSPKQMSGLDNDGYRVRLIRLPE